MMHNLFEGIKLFFEQMGTTGLGFLAFIESSVFPIPPDFLLIPMSLNEPQKALYFALICTIFSTLGGAFGYAIGKFGGRPAFHFFFKNKIHYLEKVEKLYNKYSIWAVLGAAFTPLPYKVFTIASGIFNMHLPGFLIASFIGRGARFFIVGLLLMFFGETMMKYIDIIIVVLTVLVVLLAALIYFIRKNKKKAA
ncbi:MAG: DedA family protein [Candidatus Gastranaerophilales bacterium]|nr:DedA family protein [Candidatus Gastranaerophilales bacterium]